MKKFLLKTFKYLSITLLVVVVSGFSYIAWKLYPHENLQPIPTELITLDSVEGQELLGNADYKVDYPLLDANFFPQATISYCGVASSASVLNALGKEVNQFNFFTSETDNVRSRLEVTFGGMSLPELSGLLTSHGAIVTHTHADNSTEEDFRETIRRNLASDSDYLMVNYQREILGQGRVGHISPISAYHSDRDLVLIMDTAAHKYPPTWVPVSLLFEAMLEKDNASGKSRGYIEASI